VLTGVDHVGIAVEHLEDAIEHYRRTFGLEPVHREVVESQGVEEVLFSVGESHVQLLGALGPDTPVGRFLAERGPGIHHVAYRVDDLTAVLEHLRAESVPLIDEEPRAGARVTLSSVIGRQSGHGGIRAGQLPDGVPVPRHSNQTTICVPGADPVGGAFTTANLSSCPWERGTRHVRVPPQSFHGPPARRHMAPATEYPASAPGARNPMAVPSESTAVVVPT